MTLRITPQDAEHAGLRQWLYYRRVRALALFAPEQVADAITEMRKEFPTSKLLNSALAEQIYAEGITMKDPDAAQQTFKKLLQEYPNGDAVDNAYSWMAIIMRCAGRIQEAENLNKEIIRRFPLTRHAAYALNRLAHPKRFIDRKDCGGYDYYSD